MQRNTGKLVTGAFGSEDGPNTRRARPLSPRPVYPFLIYPPCSAVRTTHCYPVPFPPLRHAMNKWSEDLRYGIRCLLKINLAVRGGHEATQALRSWRYAGWKNCIHIDSPREKGQRSGKCRLSITHQDGHDGCLAPHCVESGDCQCGPKEGSIALEPSDPIGLPVEDIDRGEGGCCVGWGHRSWRNP